MAPKLAARTSCFMTRAFAGVVSPGCLLIVRTSAHQHQGSIPPPRESNRSRRAAEGRNGRAGVRRALELRRSQHNANEYQRLSHSTRELRVLLQVFLTLL